MSSEFKLNIEVMGLILNSYKIKYKESSFYYYLEKNITLAYRGESGWVFNDENDIRYSITSNVSSQGIYMTQCRHLRREDLKRNGLLKRLKYIARDQRREEVFKKYCILECSGFINDINLLISKLMLD